MSAPDSERDPAVQRLLQDASALQPEEPYRILDNLDLTLSPELTRLLERGLIGPGSPVHKDSKKAARAFQKAFEEMGGIENLTLWGQANRSKFYALYSKMIPTTSEINEKRDITVTVKYSNPNFNTGPVSDVEDIDSQQQPQRQLKDGTN